MWQKFVSRKFILTAAIILFATGLNAAGRISGGEWVAGVTIAAGIFSGSNVVQKKVLKGE